MDEIPPLLAARNPSWFSAPLNERERLLVGEYDGWQGPAWGKVKLKENRDILEWGIVPIPGKWRLEGDVLTVWIPPTNDLYFSRLSRFGHFYGDIPLRRVKPPVTSPGTRKLTLLRAEYGAQDKIHDVTENLKSRIVGNRLTVAVNNYLINGYDPLFGVRKSLRVTYRLDDEQFQEETPEAEVLHIQRQEIERSYLPVVRSHLSPPVRYRIVTFYMDNTKEVAALQKKVFDVFGYPIDQVKTFMKHGMAVDEYLLNHRNEFDYLVLFDIDAIPLHYDTIPTLLSNMAFDDRIIGVAAQSNHISDDHPFAGVSCFGLPLKLWDDMGRPSLRGCSRSDTGEEVTWAAEEDNINVALMWPGTVEDPRWKLCKDKRLGYGTSYLASDGTPLSYHAFECRFGYERFIRKCGEVIKACS